MCEPSRVQMQPQLQARPAGFHRAVPQERAPRRRRPQGRAGGVRPASVYLCSRYSRSQPGWESRARPRAGDTSFFGQVGPRLGRGRGKENEASAPNDVTSQFFQTVGICFPAKLSG